MNNILEKHLYVNHNRSGYYSIRNNGRIIFPYKAESNKLHQGFIKNIKIV